jgi:hypothetical protein
MINANLTGHFANEMSAYRFSGRSPPILSEPAEARTPIANHFSISVSDGRVIAPLTSRLRPLIRQGAKMTPVSPSSSCSGRLIGRARSIPARFGYVLVQWPARLQ